jgi:PAS domain S-box-containing protein
MIDTSHTAAPCENDILNVSPQGIIIHESDHIRYANPACASIFGYSSRDELIDQPWERLVAPEERPNQRARTAVCLRGEAIDVNPGWQGMRSDGGRIWLESVAHPFSWQNRPAILSFVAEVTQRRRLIDQFQQAQKMAAVGRLAGGVAHDFNNLLTIIIGYSDLMLANLPRSDSHVNLLEQIQKASQRAALLTRQLLVFTRKQISRPVSTDLGALLAEMEKMLGRLVGEDIELQINAGAAWWRVRVDPREFEQVIMNLAANARDAMPTGGKLTFEVSNVEIEDVEIEEQVMLSVTDTGCGMDDATRARIFEPFFTTKVPDKGTGLGLATVDRIVSQYGGRIHVDSQPGIGTTFKIYLPRDTGEPAAHDTLASPPEPRSGCETILLVDDDHAVRTLARLVLSGHGYTVLEASQGSEALHVCNQHEGRIDLMVSDVVMPAMRGAELAERARGLQPNMRVLFLSGFTDDAVGHEGMPAARPAFLPKPFTPDTLARKVREVLDA